MQHVDRIGQAGGVDDSIDAGIIPYSNLFHALADGGHGLEVIRLLAALYELQLLASVMPCVLRKFPQSLQ